MKSQLTAKYLQFLSKKNKKQDAGFTLIELLVVIIIIGILSAIALPSFLNQAAKARGAEAKSNVGAMNRAQQAYFLEQQEFTTNPSELGLSMANSTDNFTYTAEVNGQLEPTEDDPTAGVTNLATSKKPDIKGYAGSAFYQAGSTTTILCEANDGGTEEVAAPTSVTEAVADDPDTADVDESVPAGINCGGGSKEVK